MLSPLAIAAGLVLFSHLCTAALTAAQCSGLASIPLPRQVTVVNATSVPISVLNSILALSNSSLTQYPSLDPSAPLCRVYGQVNVQNQSTINFELWLPDESLYNGRYLAVGNGGYAGVIDESAMVVGLSEGFAVAGGDGGHLLALNSAGPYYPFFHNDVQTLEWIRDSIAAFTVPARHIQAIYYGQPPSYSYYTGCSTGGAQAFALAQRHPDLFDGIYASCPGNWYSHLVLMFLWNYNHAQGLGFMNQSTLNFITERVLAKCDASDGVADGILEDPQACDFNIMSLQCTNGMIPVVKNVTVCLTPAQVSTAQAFYQGPRDSRSGATIYPGFEFGSEISWLYQETVLAPVFTNGILQNLVFNLTYNESSFNFGSDVDIADAKAGSLIDHVSTDMHSFFNRGGKLIMSQGLADPLNPASWPTQYIQQISEVTVNASDYIRLFNIPGGGHCGPAAGYPQAPAVVSYIQPLMNWVELGQAPSQLRISQPANGANTTKKLCPYPQNAVFLGGDSSDWNSYVCR